VKISNVLSDGFMNSRQVILPLSLLLLHCGSSSDKHQVKHTIQVKGSDTMVNIAQAWAEEYKRVVPTVNVEVSGGGSGVGIAALVKGAVDIANASRDMKNNEKELAIANTGKTPVEFIVGFDALAVFVHKDNPMEEISLEQLTGIFADNGTIRNWSQLGISIPGKRNDKIIRVSRQSSSGTYEFFRDRVFPDRDFRLGSLDMNGSKEVVELVSHTPTAIGYSGMGYATAGVKMLDISLSESAPAIPITVENTQNRRYPLARSLQIYTLGEPQGAVKNYIDWILSPAGQKIVEDNGYVPVPANSPDTAAKDLHSMGFLCRLYCKS
jgi:phosphate transport system substrate-binding protein